MKARLTAVTATAVALSALTASPGPAHAQSAADLDAPPVLEVLALSGNPDLTESDLQPLQLHPGTNSG